MVKRVTLTLLAIMLIAAPAYAQDKTPRWPARRGGPSSAAPVSIPGTVGRNPCRRAFVFERPTGLAWRGGFDNFLEMFMQGKMVAAHIKIYKRTQLKSPLHHVVKWIMRNVQYPDKANLIKPVGRNPCRWECVFANPTVLAQRGGFDNCAGRNIT